jgi:FMN-dependent oxidoreductase (nitrilotriacetate monooxygenase family)
MSRQLHLNAFLRNIGQHESAWRLPETNLNGITEVDHYIGLAKTAERGLLDAIFFADHPVLKDRTQDRPFDALDPLSLLAALSTVTERIGLVATASTTYNDPYSLARRFATVDHLSHGRAGWNIVTTANADAAANFGAALHPDPNQRYERADEFIDVALKLWDSWDDDALVGDKRAGVFADPDRIHHIDHHGKHFDVRGPLEVPRSPQGRPVLFQAGSSEPGKQLAAKYAEAIFTAQPELASAQDFYRDIKQRVRAHGRDPEGVKVLPGLSVFIGGTEAEARARQNQFEDLIIPSYGLAQLSRITGLEYSEDDLDRPFELPLHEASQLQMKSRVELLWRISQGEKITVRQLLRRLSAGRGHRVFAGTPEQAADNIETWFRSGAADGFNLIPPALPASLVDFVEHVVPLLQRRNLFRQEYTGRTLRHHLGLTRPAPLRGSRTPQQAAA